MDILNTSATYPDEAAAAELFVSKQASTEAHHCGTQWNIVYLTLFFRTVDRRFAFYKVS